MACCGQTAPGTVKVWHLRGVPGDKEPREYADQATALREQQKVGGVVLSVIKRVK